MNDELQAARSRAFNAERLLDETRDEVERLEHENARLRNAGRNPFERIASEASRADRADRVIAEAEKVIADRGVFERDCTAPLPERIDSLIVEQKSAEYWSCMHEMEVEKREKAESELARIRSLLADLEWSGQPASLGATDRVPICPKCGMHPVKGHASDCPLKAALDGR